MLMPICAAPPASPAPALRTSHTHYPSCILHEKQGFDNVNNILSSNDYAPGVLIQALFGALAQPSTWLDQLSPRRHRL